MARYSFLSLILVLFLFCKSPLKKTEAPNKLEDSKEQLAEAASKNGEWLKAAKLFEELYQKESSNEQLNYEAGTNYLRANYQKKALTILLNYDKTKTDTTVEFNGRMARIAKAYYQLGAYHKIEEVVKNYDYPKMYRGLAREHLKGLIQLNQLEKVASFFGKYQKEGIYDDKGKKTNTGFLFRGICNELLVVGNQPALKKYAQKYYDWAITRKEKDKRNLAIATFYQNSGTKAISHLKTAINAEKSPRHRMELEGLLGICYANNKEEKKAILQIEKIQNAPPLPYRHDAFGAKFYHQARIEVALKQKEQAINSLKKALEAKAEFWSNRFKEDGLLKDLFQNKDFQELVIPSLN